MNSVKIEPQRRPHRGSYHHGALREALIEQGEAVLVERGLSGFSLREVARRAGVSPAAPAHHFKDARGLLTAIAARGFERLTGALAEAGREGRSNGQLRAQAEAYIDFALKNGALFTLMWMRDILNVGDLHYLASGRSAFNLFERAALGRATPRATGPHTPDPAVVAAWAMIHGYARLALDGALGDASSALLPAVLHHLPRAAPEQPGTSEQRRSPHAG